jgi:hypothetical protein
MPVKKYLDIFFTEDDMNVECMRIEDIMNIIYHIRFKKIIFKKESDNTIFKNNLEKIINYMIKIGLNEIESKNE